MSSDMYKWQSSKSLADAIGAHKMSVSRAIRNDVKLKGEIIERRAATDEDRARGACPSNAKFVYRVAGAPKPEEQGHNIEDLLADLAGCEVRIEELEAELLDSDKTIDRMKAEISLAWDVEHRGQRIKELEKELEDTKAQLASKSISEWGAQQELGLALHRAEEAEAEVMRLEKLAEDDVDQIDQLQARLDHIESSRLYRVTRRAVRVARFLPWVETGNE